MHRLNELAAQLTPAQVKELEDYAERLLTGAGPGGGRTPPGEPRKIRFDGWAGCLAHVHPEMSDKEFNDMILDEWAKAGED